MYGFEMGVMEGAWYWGDFFAASLMCKSRFIRITFYVWYTFF